MTTTSDPGRGLSGNMLKLIALTTMTIDHIGAIIFPELTFLRIIGRTAMPIFSFAIAEGCRYTKSRKMYFLKIFLTGLLCQLVYFVAEGSLNMCILITFSLSLLLIYTLDFVSKKKNLMGMVLFTAVFLGIYFISEIMPSVLSKTDFAIDYGFMGILAPVAIYAGKTREQKLLYAAMAMCALSMTLGGVQWYSLLAIPLLMLYNGTRGRANIKSLFYIYYPLHLAIIHLIGAFLF